MKMRQPYCTISAIAIFPIAMTAVSTHAQPLSSQQQLNASTQSNDQDRSAVDPMSQLRGTIQLHLDNGTADPAADANAAANRGNFGLFGAGDGARGGRGIPSIICFTPDGQAPDIIFWYAHSDYITEEVGSWLNYAAEYNRTIVERTDYSDADLCRMATPEDRQGDNFFNINRVAQ